jgi:predicted phage gp36 major capsid-like protein
MVVKKSSTAATAPKASEAEPTKAELQRKMEEAREDISQTVADIKETVTDQYESVKETVTETLDWREQFRKHSVAWSLGALAIGYVVGSGLAASLTDTPKKGGRRDDGILSEIYAIGETLSDELSGVAQTVLLPALAKKIKDTFGIDLSDKLLAAKSANRSTRSSKRTTKKSASKKSGSKKSGAKKHASGKRAANKGGAE